MVDWTLMVSVLQYVVICLINIGVAYSMTEYILSFLLKMRPLPKIETFTGQPKVAILYLTCDDVQPSLVRLLKQQNYMNCDYFILDDSIGENHKAIINSFKDDFTIVRRETRRGNKAGNLNNWLQRFGMPYEYLVVADSDSILSEDFVERMLQYAQHPSNAGIAIFQSQVLSWNVNMPFVKILTCMAPLNLYSDSRIANNIGRTLSWGHNDLVRVSCLREIGGYDENYVSEDFATSLRLIEKGYSIKLVDLISYEALPHTIQIFSSRAVRYAKQSYEILKLLKTKIPFYMKFHLFMSSFSYLIVIPYFIGMFLGCWGYSSNFDDLLFASEYIYESPLSNYLLSVPFILMIVYLAYYALRGLPLVFRLRLSVLDYFINQALVLTMGFYMMIPTFIELIKTIFGERVKFNVTRSLGKTDVSFYDIVKGMRSMIFLTIIIIVVTLFINPLGMLYNILWLLPLIVCPIIIYLAHVPFVGNMVSNKVPFPSNVRRPHVNC